MCTPTSYSPETTLTLSVHKVQNHHNVIVGWTQYNQWKAYMNTFITLIHLAVGVTEWYSTQNIFQQFKMVSKTTASGHSIQLVWRLSQDTNQRSCPFLMSTTAWIKMCINTVPLHWFIFTTIYCVNQTSTKLYVMLSKGLWKCIPPKINSWDWITIH